MIRLALFISGGGSTACAVINACRQNILKIKPVLVIASKYEAFGIDKIIQLGFPKRNIQVINPKNYNNSECFADSLLYECHKKKVDLIGQYGWLPLTPEKLIAEFKNKIINQHPGPLDQNGIDFGGKGMYGRRVHAAVLYFRRKSDHDYWTEATCHLVTEKFDRGKVIGSTKIPIEIDDTVESLQQKVLPQEHKLQIKVLEKFAEAKIRSLKRKKPLISKNEIKILREAKLIAKILYPNG